MFRYGHSNSDFAATKSGNHLSDRVIVKDRVGHDRLYHDNIILSTIPNESDKCRNHETASISQSFASAFSNGGAKLEEVVFN